MVVEMKKQDKEDDEDYFENVSALGWANLIQLKYALCCNLCIDVLNFQLMITSGQF